MMIKRIGFLALVVVFAGCSTDSQESGLDLKIIKGDCTSPSSGAKVAANPTAKILFVSKDSLDLKLTADVNCGSNFTQSVAIEGGNTLHVSYTYTGAIAGCVCRSEHEIAVKDKNGQIDMNKITGINFNGEIFDLTP